MAATRRAARAEQAPDDLAGKRSATTALQAVKAETRAEQTIDDDGFVTVTLQSKQGFGDFRVPPHSEWTSIARNALNRNDDLTWAQQTLPLADAMRWMNLNPTMNDINAFFTRLGEALGASLPE